MKKKAKSPSQSNRNGKKRPQPNVRVLDADDFSYSGFSRIMNSVNLNGSGSSQNEHSISDGMGGRIELELNDYKK